MNSPKKSKLSTLVQRLQLVLREAGVPTEAAGIGVRCRFQLPAGRNQVVEIDPMVQTPDGRHVIGFFARCQRLGMGPFGQLSRRQALRLLELNGTLAVGHFCTRVIEGQRYLGVLSTQLLETMDRDELSIHLDAVARLADQWEERLRQDDF
jgi:hypothetical protein